MAVAGLEKIDIGETVSESTARAASPREDGRAHDGDGLGSTPRRSPAAKASTSPRGTSEIGSTRSAHERRMRVEATDTPEGTWCRGAASCRWQS